MEYKAESRSQNQGDKITLSPVGQVSRLFIYFTKIYSLDRNNARKKTIKTIIFFKKYRNLLLNIVYSKRLFLFDIVFKKYLPEEKLTITILYKKGTNEIFVKNTCVDYGIYKISIISHFCKRVRNLI